MEITMEYIVGMLIIVITGILYLWINALQQLKRQLFINSISLMLYPENINDISELYYLSTADLTAFKIKLNEMRYPETMEI
jgi:hypothetical protein